MERQAYEITRYFSEECGFRTAGNGEVLKAVDYIEEFYKKEAINAIQHEFSVPVCQIIRSELKAKINNEWISLQHTPALFSKGTPEEGITAPLVYIENGSEGIIRKKDIKGKIVLISRDVYFEYPDITMYKKLEGYGPAGIIYCTSDGHRGIPYVYANFETMDESYTIPTAVVHFDEALKLAKSKDVEIYYNVQFDVKKSKSKSIIGKIEAEDPDADNIVICAHIDSSFGSVGATDDAGGVAMVMVLAKYYSELAKKGLKPKKNLLFAAWSGHECGIHGSRYFLQDHSQIFEKIKFTLNYDVIGTALAFPAIVAGCNHEVEQKLSNIVNELGYEWPITISPMVVDTLNFAAREIPHLTLTSGIFRSNHTLGDNMDLVSEEGFTSPIEFSKAVIDWVANAEEVSQGYSEELAAAMKACVQMYGWGL